MPLLAPVLAAVLASGVTTVERPEASAAVPTSDAPTFEGGPSTGPVRLGMPPMPCRITS